MAVFLLASRAHGDLNVLPAGGKKLHEARDGVCPGLAAHQARDVRLFDTENVTGGGLSQAALLDARSACAAFCTPAASRPYSRTSSG